MDSTSYIHWNGDCPLFGSGVCILRSRSGLYVVPASPLQNSARQPRTGRTSSASFTAGTGRTLCEYVFLSTWTIFLFQLLLITQIAWNCNEIEGRKMRLKSWHDSLWRWSNWLLNLLRAFFSNLIWDLCYKLHRLFLCSGDFNTQITMCCSCVLCVFQNRLQISNTLCSTNL